MKPLWQPSLASQEKSQLFQFIQQVNEHFDLSFKNYSELYRWSIENPTLFWPQIIKFTQIKFHQPWKNVLQNPNAMPGAKWFEGATLNFAENLLRHRGDKTAIIFRGENGARQTLSYDQLYAEVAAKIEQLKQWGVGIGDRVAGWMPNCPETVIAMLATTALGAIWSSCSPEFGVAGVRDRFSQITPKILFVADGQFYQGKAHSLLSKIEELKQDLPSVEQVVIVPFLEQPSSKSLLSPLTRRLRRRPLPQGRGEKDLFTPLPFDHPIYILYSSGTTGAPKCIVHGAGNVLLQHLKELQLHTDLKPSDTIFYYTTCGWMMWNWMVSSLAVGATVVLYDGSPLHPRESQLFDLIEEEKITVFGTSAKYLSTIEKKDLKPIHTHDLSSLRTILSTGSPLLPENFDYVYQNIKSDLCLSSISGGTDIVSCFALGNPMLPVYRGQLQCLGLGMKVEIFDETGKSVREKKGELVCTAPFPSMPVGFWNDAEGKKYHKAYFEKYPNAWSQGDYAEITAQGGMIIYGRSDAVLNPGGIRIGTAEIYAQVETIPEVIESLAVGLEMEGDVRVFLFVKLQEGLTLDENLIQTIKQTIRQNASPHHVPAKIIQVPDLPRTLNNKLSELAVRDVLQGKPIQNKESLANPESLAYFENLIL